ncbi:hypothetical protein DM860_009499 [Cuscuta australis]|uniref:Uncharacterized protein n=1 Tax=Cuscuta australis TaxID=267555 RepID=A0A328DIL5_9ASTE|nr:hypothetical protein DM860_009499 [Cuscuta australis]
MEGMFGCDGREFEGGTKGKSGGCNGSVSPSGGGSDDGSVSPSKFAAACCNGGGKGSAVCNVSPEFAGPTRGEMKKTGEEEEEVR